MNNPITMDAESRRRYARNISLPEIGMEGQSRICRSSVLVVGAGALGCIVSQYLAASGLGALTIVDYDTVDISNLQRQIAYETTDAGKSKAEILARHLNALNPECHVTTHLTPFTRANADMLVDRNDIIIDCSDNGATKQLCSATAHRHDKPCIIGGVSGFRGQIITLIPEGNKGSEYENIFGDVTGAVSCGLTGCNASGVFGPAAGCVATWQAAQGLKIAAGIDMSSGMTLIDTLRMTTIHLKL